MDDLLPIVPLPRHYALTPLPPRPTQHLLVDAYRTWRTPSISPNREDNNISSLPAHGLHTRIGGILPTVTQQYVPVLQVLVQYVLSTYILLVYQSLTLRGYFLQFHLFMFYS